MFRLVSSETLRRAIKECEDLARKLQTRDHSNDPTGEEQEDIPGWALNFFAYFDAVSSTETNNQRIVRQRGEMRVNAQSILGSRAPLGYDANHPAQLRIETLGIIGGEELCVRDVGDVYVEEVGVNPHADLLIEGRDD